MKRPLILAALLLPLVGLLAGMVINTVQRADAVHWVIPVTGYDPRDPLRGHFIAFRYDWTVDGDAGQCRAGLCMICLEQHGETVVARVVPRDSVVTCPARVDPLASSITSDFGSRIFVSEASAPALEAALRRGPMAVETLLTRDGRLINQRLVPLTH